MENSFYIYAYISNIDFISSKIYNIQWILCTAYKGNRSSKRKGISFEDNEISAYDLTNYLIDAGYKDIGIITGKLTETSAIERLKGWEKAMENSGLKIRQEFIGIGEFKMESGYNFMKKMLELDRKPKAILAANNNIAYGAVQAIRESGLDVPEDVYIVCFDAIDNTNLLSVHFPSMVQPAKKIGEIALETVLKDINNKEYKIYDKVVLEPMFIE
ncbi:MAG: LacI family transcriptional regulator [Clostridiales bacterium]|nr:LacI family transcriptional regulator [Clostridiales bacterium]